MIMYADFSVIIRTNKEVEQLKIDIYIAISMAQEYSVKNNLMFNKQKTNQLTTGTHKFNVIKPSKLESTNRYYQIFWHYSQ